MIARLTVNAVYDTLLTVSYEQSLLLHNDFRDVVTIHETFYRSYKLHYTLAPIVKAPLLTVSFLLYKNTTCSVVDFYYGFVINTQLVADMTSCHRLPFTDIHV